MKQLPQYFTIKKAKSPLWSKYIDWLNKTYNTCFSKDLDYYYGFDGVAECATYFKSFNQGTVLITLEQWDECVNGKKLTLQHEFIIEITEDTRNININHPDAEDLQKRWRFVKYPFEISKYWTRLSNTNNLPITTYKQFLEMQTKQIIGYKLIKTQYLQQAVAIGQTGGLCSFNTFPTFKTDKVVLCENEGTIRNLKEAGVLDFWFEPVFFEEKIMVGEYEIKFNQEGFFSKSCVINKNAYSLDQLLQLRDLFLSSNGQIHSLNVGCNGQYKVDLIKIQDIIKKLT